MDELEEVEAVPLNACFRRFVVEAQGTNDTLAGPSDEIPWRTCDKRWHRSIFRDRADELIPIRAAEQIVGSHSQPPKIARCLKRESEPVGERKRSLGSFDDTNRVLLPQSVWQANSFGASEQNFC